MPLSADQIRAAFARLSDQLANLGEKAEVFVVGGAVMCVVHDARPSTKDVDAWFKPTVSVRMAAKRVAEELGLDPDWLNDAAKGFLPADARYEEWFQAPNLTVSVANMETLLAMKVLAARTQEDAADIAFLAKKMTLTSAEAVLAVVERYYPRSQIQVRSQLLVEEIFT